MDQIAQIMELVKPITSKMDLKVYEIKWINEKNNRILQVAIMRQDGSMNIDLCQEVSESLSLVLDESNLNLNDYYLEVCSPGAERQVKDLSELPNLIGKHLFVRTKIAYKKQVEFLGDLLKVDGDEIVMNYRDKSRKLEVTIKLEDIDFCRLAVKI